MKYLQDDRLAEMTARLTDCRVGGDRQRSFAQRVVNGRLEVYIMKRTGPDKKYAIKLGEQWVAWQKDSFPTVPVGMTEMHRRQHSQSDWSQVTSPAASSLQPAVVPANDQQQRFEDHLPSHAEEDELTHKLDAKTSTFSNRMPDEAPSITSLSTRRKRSQSAGIFEEASALSAAAYSPSRQHSYRPRSMTQMATSASIPTTTETDVLERAHKVARRARASSFDATRRYRHAGLGGDDRSIPSWRWPPPNNLTLSPWPMSTPLGDFAEPSTRRLLTDLILTLNCSFPDYDFESVRPTDFTKLTVAETCQKVNELLSDVTLQEPDFLTYLWLAVDAAVTLADCEVYSYQPSPSDDQDDDPMSFLTQTLVATPAGGSLATAASPPPLLNPGNSFVTRTWPHDVEPSNGGHVMGSSDTAFGIRPLTTRVSSSDRGPHQTVLWTFNYFFVNKNAKRVLLFACVETVRSGRTVAVVGDDDGLALIGEDDDDIDNNDDDDLMDEPASMVVLPRASHESADGDFDLDPAATPAGGIPISSI